MFESPLKRNVFTLTALAISWFLGCAATLSLEALFDQPIELSEPSLDALPDTPVASRSEIR